MRTLRIRPALALLAASALVGALAPAASAVSTTAAGGHHRACAAADLSYEAGSAQPVQAGALDEHSIFWVGVTNGGSRSCTIDRFPTVTFAGLDGAARPVPETQSGPHWIKAGQTRFAALDTYDTAGEPRYVDALTVAADPGHVGVTFVADELDAPPPGIAVYDPCTTLWHDTIEQALDALPVG